MYLALTPLPSDGRTDRWRVAEVSADGTVVDSRTLDAGGLAVRERDHPRWVLDSCRQDYPAVLAAGVTLQRCHDVALTERILLARDGRFGEPVRAAAVWARRHGVGAPADPEPAAEAEPGLFELAGDAPAPVEPVPALAEALDDQLRRVGVDRALGLLIAAESACGLAAVEMGAAGLPWDVTEHDRLLTELLGPRPAPGARPARMAELAERIADAFGFAVNPDSAVALREAFRRIGFDVDSTRSWVLQQLDHPAVEPVLAYKELARLYTANGWNWIDEWVTEGRLHTEFLPGGVVSGRWATKGGGGLQIPRVVRGAARALPGRRLVVADAAQLEPRVLAAISGDRALQAVATEDDLYAGLAADGFGGDRAAAKLAMLGAMYGQTSGEAGRLVATLRQRYPQAMACVESAAARGEVGGVVHSVLGRASPPPDSRWRAAVAAGADETSGAAATRRAREMSRSWGRFTRNFVVQASAADWAAVWLATLRAELPAVSGAELVFFQHDELVMHAPSESAEAVADLAVRTAAAATDLVFPGTSTAVPVRPMVVTDYGRAK